MEILPHPTPATSDRATPPKPAVCRPRRQCGVRDGARGSWGGARPMLRNGCTYYRANPQIYWRNDVLEPVPYGNTVAYSSTRVALMPP